MHHDAAHTVPNLHELLHWNRLSQIDDYQLSQDLSCILRNDQLASLFIVPFLFLREIGSLSDGENIIFIEIEDCP